MRATRIYIQPTPASDPTFDERWRMCFRKIAYPNSGEATQAAKKQTKRWKRKYRAYPCPVCHLWHITKKAEHEVGTPRGQATIEA